jgi:hypothetical protein
MSSLLYGAMSRKRSKAPSNARIWVLPAPKTYLTGIRDLREEDAATIERVADDLANEDTAAPISRWVDAAAALVPAEVLAIHAFVVSIGTETTGTGKDAVTKFTHADGVMWSFYAMLVLCLLFYLAGAKSFNWRGDFVRILIPAGAFVGWTMIQPNTAFDALGFDLDTEFGRPVIAVFLIVVLGILAGLLAKKADDSGSAL